MGKYEQYKNNYIFNSLLNNDNFDRKLKNVKTMGSVFIANFESSGGSNIYLEISSKYIYLNNPGAINKSLSHDLNGVKIITCNEPYKEMIVSALEGATDDRLKQVVFFDISRAVSTILGSPIIYDTTRNVYKIGDSGFYYELILDDTKLLVIKLYATEEFYERYVVVLAELADYVMLDGREF